MFEAKPTDLARIEAYLAGLDADKRAALVHLRARVREAAPLAEEALVYGVPGFRQDGPLVCYAAFKDHCGFYPMSPAVIEALGSELAGFETAKGTVRFTPDRPIPDALIADIVARRRAENAAKIPSRQTPKKKKD